MNALPNDRNKRTRRDGQDVGLSLTTHGHTFDNFSLHGKRSAHQRDEPASELQHVAKSSTSKLSQYPPSPSASGDGSEDTLSIISSNWKWDSSSTLRDRKANDVYADDRLYHVNDVEVVPSVVRNAKIAALAPSQDEDTASEDGNTPEDRSIENDGRRRVRKLSSAKMYELTTSSKALPLYSSSPHEDGTQDIKSLIGPSLNTEAGSVPAFSRHDEASKVINGNRGEEGANRGHKSTMEDQGNQEFEPQAKEFPDAFRHQLRTPNSSTSGLANRRSSRFSNTSRSPGFPSSEQSRSTPTPLALDKNVSALRNADQDRSIPSPMPSSGWPALPGSLPEYLQLELSLDTRSDAHIHRSAASEIPYESSAVKVERLLNFLLLPPQLEQVLWFGALACLDAWLYTFTILPLRFIRALFMLIQSWSGNLMKEVKFIGAFVYSGAGRMWHRRGRKSSVASADSVDVTKAQGNPPEDNTQKEDGVSFPQERPKDTQPHPPPSNRRRRGSTTYKRHRRTKSTPSALRQNHKADLLKGLLISISCTILMYFDASRMYHGIRGQAAIKLYVIYNVLEVCDRLFSAIGQDVLECLFSKEALERKPDGRSKVLRPFWLFTLALLYNLVHATALFYQVITLNVAVNSYSNALLTLLMSNQFVEIKSTVFKKFEKENLFQLTCADIVERFQLWLMLTIIAARNIIETGGLSLSSSNSAASTSSSSILPKSFTLFSPWYGQIMGPFLLVLGSEMLVDWIKHAYITKFNLTKPAIYGRFLDVLAKDYYSNAFVDQNLTRRLGLPVIPLSCLFIRASVQTYHMFLATHMPMPIPSIATSLSVEEATSSPATTAALHHIDHIFRRALGRSTFGDGSSSSSSRTSWPFNFTAYLTTDDLIAFSTMALFFLLLFLLLLALKLVLGMCLLSFARRRYIGMKEREKENGIQAEGKRVGGWGVVEVDEDKRRWIYMDDPEGARRLRESEKARVERRVEGEGFGIVERYKMVAKRIW